MFVELPEGVSEKERFAIIRNRLGVKKEKVYYYRISDDFVIAYYGRGGHELRIGRLIRKLLERERKFAVIGQAGERVYLYYQDTEKNERRFYVVDVDEKALRVFLDEEVEVGTPIYVYGTDDFKNLLESHVMPGLKHSRESFKTPKVNIEDEDLALVAEEKDLMEEIKGKLESVFGKFLKKKKVKSPDIFRNRTVILAGFAVMVLGGGFYVINGMGSKKEELAPAVVKEDPAKIRFQKNQFVLRYLSELDKSPISYMTYDGNTISLIVKRKDMVDKAFVRVGDVGVVKVNVVPVDSPGKKPTDGIRTEIAPVFSALSGKCAYFLYRGSYDSLFDKVLKPVLSSSQSVEFTFTCDDNGSCSVEVKTCKG